MTTYKLNPETVKQADAPRTERIDTTGAYTGVITLAKQIVAGSGTEGIEFTFQADDGRVANWLRLYTRKADGTETFGMGLLMSAMTCLKLREISTETVTIEEWDHNANARVPVDVTNFSDLCNKPIGILLQKELKDGYDKNGNPKYAMNIAGFFDAKTRMTATEILEKATKAEALDKKIKYLKDKDSRTGDDGGFSGPSNLGVPPLATSFPAGADDLSDLENDIPF